MGRRLQSTHLVFSFHQAEVLGRGQLLRDIRGWPPRSSCKPAAGFRRCNEECGDGKRSTPGWGCQPGTKLHLLPTDKQGNKIFSKASAVLTSLQQCEETYLRTPVT